MEPLRPRRVLIVDDSEELAENLAEILAIDGHVTSVAHSAEQALSIVESSGLDVIVTEYWLPGLNGADLLRTLRAAGQTVHAIVISGYGDEDAMDEASRAGARFVSKPIDCATLSRLVREGSS